MLLSRILSITIVVMASTAVMAQDPGLNTEITVDREIIPEHVEASRLRVVPKLVLPAVAMPKLQVADRTGATSIDPYVDILAPAKYAMTRDSVLWRGYVQAGFLPTDYNLSAGYGFHVADNTRIDAFLQFDGISYKGDMPVLNGDGMDYFRDRLHRNALVFGATSHTDIKRDAYLDAYMMFGGSAYNIPSVSYAAQYNEETSVPELINDDAGADMRRVMAGLSFGTTSGKWKFDGGLHYTYFDLDVEQNSRSEHMFALDLMPSYRMSEFSAAGIDIAVKAMDATAGFTNRGIVHVAPHYKYANGGFNVRLGVSVDAKLGNARSSALFAPDLSVAWTPSSFVTLWGKMDGKLEPNQLSALYDFTPYLSFMQPYGYSRIPVDAKVGVTFGPLTGLALELRAGFASVEDWLVYSPEARRFDVSDASSLSFGATLSYRYGDVFDMNITADFYGTPDGYGYPYHMGTSMVSDVQLCWHPIRKLALNAGFSYRQHDKQLGDPLNLSIGASYRVVDRLTAFVRCENITGSKYYIVYGIPAQRFHGLVGLSYLF